MSMTSNESLGFHARMSQLELRLKESEDERFKLEERFNQLLRSTKSEESKQLFQLRGNYCQLLEKDRLRCDRNDLILRTLNRIENRTSMLTAKTDRLRLLRQYYESYMDRHDSNWKRSDMKCSNVLGSMNDLSETSPSLRPPSPTTSLFSSSHLPLFTSTPSTTRRSSLVVPDLDLESLKYKFACETGSSTLPTRRKLFGDSKGLKSSLNNEKRSDSKAYTENIEATRFIPNVKSKDLSNLQISTSTMDFEQSTTNDLLQLSLNDDDSNYLPKNKNRNSKVDTLKPKTNYLSNLHSPNAEYKQNASIFRENKSAKTSPRTSSKPLAKSCSFNAASSYLNRPDRYISTERRSNLIRRPSLAHRSTMSPQPNERLLSSEARVSPSAAHYTSKSPLRVVDDIFKKYLINYDKRYLSDPISESKYGKYLYPSRNYECGEKKFNYIKGEISQPLFDSRYNDLIHVHRDKQLYPSSKESVNSNQFDTYKSHGPVYKSVSKSTGSGLDMDSPRSTYSNDWKDWDHYRNRYEYTTDDDMRSYQTVSSHVENPKYVNRTTYENRDSVPQIYVDSSNINYLNRIDPYHKAFDYQRSNYPTSKTFQDQHLSGNWYSDDNYSSLGAKTLNHFEQSLKAKDSTKMPQTPKKVSFSNEFLYDDRFDLEADSLADETIAQDADNICSEPEQNLDFIQSNDSNCNSFISHDRNSDKKINGNLTSYKNESKDAVLENKTNVSDPPLEATVEIREQECLTSPNCVDKELLERELDLQNGSDSSINSKLAENQTAKESVVSTTKTENVFDQNVTELAKSLDNETKNDIKDDKSQSEIISNEFQDSKLGMLQEREVADTISDFNDESIKIQEQPCEKQSYEHKPTVEGDQGNVNINNEESHSREHQLESSRTDGISDLANNDSIHQTYGEVDSQEVLKHHEENKTENSNLEGYQEPDQNVLYGDVNTNPNPLQDNDYVDQSYQDKMAYGDDNLSQYNTNYEQVPYDPSQSQYEQQVTQGYHDDNYTEQSVPEYDKVQGAYETENVIQSYQEQPQVYDNQYPESGYEQPVNYDTESYRQDYEQPAAEQYEPTDYQQEQFVKEEEHFSPSHYQSQPAREYATEQYQEEYPHQPVHYENNYQDPADPGYQKEQPQYGYDNPEAVFDPTVQPEQYGQYDQQQYDQQPQPFDQYEQQQQPYDQYDQQPKEYDEYKEQSQLYDQQPKQYDEYEQPQQYDQQPEQYDEYAQQPQQYDQQPEAYDEYAQQPQQYAPYEQEQQQQPHDQYDQGDPGNYNQYEHQQKDQYGSQYQGEPDQFGDYNYNYDGQNVAADPAYRGNEPLAYNTDQPQTYADDLQHPETAQQPYDVNAQLPYGENIQPSYDGPQQTYSESQVNYRDEKRSYEDLNQDLGRSYQGPLPATGDQPLNKPGTAVQESVYDSGADQVYSETADSRAAPNLSRVLESDSDSARAQDPQETHENSSDFDFSSGPK